MRKTIRWSGAREPRIQIGDGKKGSPQEGAANRSVVAGMPCWCGMSQKRFGKMHLLCRRLVDDPLIFIGELQIMIHPGRSQVGKVLNFVAAIQPYRDERDRQ